MSDWRVWFEGELHISFEGNDPPLQAEIWQAVQDEIGHTGAIVTDVIDYREEAV